MNVYSINSYSLNIYPRRNTDYKAVPQMSFQGGKGVNTKLLTKDVVSITKKFEELSPKVQRNAVKRILTKNKYSDKTIQKLMEYQDKSIPLLKELLEILEKNKLQIGKFIDEEDLPAKVEFLNNYIPVYGYDSTIKLFGLINRFNLPLFKQFDGLQFIELKKLIENVQTKEDADSKIEAYNTLKSTIFEESLSHIWNPSDLDDVTTYTDKHNLSLLKRLCRHENFRNEKPDNIVAVMKSADKDNAEYKLKTFDLINDLDYWDSSSYDILKVVTKQNYPLVAYFLKEEGFPTDDIPKIAKDVASKDCRSKIKMYEYIDSVPNHIYIDWDLTTRILSATGVHNITLGKAMLKDKHIDKDCIPDVLSENVAKKDEITKLHAYNILKEREDLKFNDDAIPRILECMNEDKMDLFNALMSNPKITTANMVDVIERVNEYSQPFLIKLIKKIPKGMSNDDLSVIMCEISPHNLSLAENILYDDNFSTEFKEYFLRNTKRIPEGISDMLLKTGIKSLYDKYKEIENNVMNNPEIYINGEYNNREEMFKDIKRFFNRNTCDMMRALYVFDKKALDDLLRMRLKKAEKYLDYLHKFDEADLKLLKALCDSKNIDGKPLSSSQKIEMIYILKSYYYNNMSLIKIIEMAERGQVNIDELNSDLLNTVFKNMEIDTSRIPKEKLLKWDLKYIHLLALELKSNFDEDKKLYNAVISAANSEKSFKDFIQDSNNEYGCNNKSAMLDFKELKMDYDKWVNPDEKNNVHFFYRDENKERLSQISKQIEEDMNALLHTPVAKFVKKQLPEYVKYTDKYYNQTDIYTENLTDIDVSFEIPNDYKTSKPKLQQLVKMLIDTSKEGQLTTVWNNAKNNLSNTQRQERAKKTLMILNHLEQRLKDLENADIVRANNLDLTIKMWDRIPQKDLFQGNYSSCCIGMDETNGWSMPVYLLNTAFNMIELVNNNTGETVGNALCYFVKDKDNNPVFIIDNIEIKNSVKPSDEVGVKLREAITEYAQNITHDVTGRNDIQILLGENYNDVPDDDLNKIFISLQPMGTLEEDVYTDAMDYDTEWYIYNTLYKLV